MSNSIFSRSVKQLTMVKPSRSFSTASDVISPLYARAAHRSSSATTSSKAKESTTSAAATTNDGSGSFKSFAEYRVKAVQEGPIPLSRYSDEKADSTTREHDSEQAKFSEQARGKEYTGGKK